MSEYSAVQGPMIRYATEIGWEEVSPEEALRLRDGERGVYFTDTLRAQLLRLNPGVVDPSRAEDILRQLKLLRPTIEGNRDALAWLRGEQSVFVTGERRERNVRLINFEQPAQNIFQVTKEWRQHSTVYRNRADVVFLINGIQVAVAEAKNVTRRDGIAEGVEQIRRYQRETPELFTAAQVFEVTHLLDFCYGATWSANRKNLFNWKDVGPEDNYEQKVKRFLDHDLFLRLLRDYILFLTRDDVVSKVILRQHQMRAVEKTLARIQDADKRRGLIWHTQGSGKTLTMLTIATRLLAGAAGEKPLVLMLVDRNELEGQLFQNITAAGVGAVRVAQTKADLRDILASDYRGLVISMIHKFDDIRANINTRKSIVVLVDEAHRTTGGDLGNYLMGALPNAPYIGFTGTPIDALARGKGTFKVFGVDDEEGYLDKYSIAESIQDGTTVKLNYALAPSDLRVDRETLERQFLALADAEGVSDIEELNAILDRAVELKEIMKAPGRIAQIAAFVAQHFRENVAPMGFKAFLVAVDREACALYKRELDKHLPPEWSAVVYSPSSNDSDDLKQHYLSSEREMEVRKAFARKDKEPKILIVTEKLLTGFDAPILYCMYLDKPMRDHVLLQAIARVNRPYEDEEGLVKPYGFVLDFVGIFERLETALAFDSDVVGAVIENIDVLKQLFAQWMQTEAQPYLPYTKGADDKAKERAILYFQEKRRREDFLAFIQRLQNLYDVLSPDASLRPYLEDYLALVELATLIRNAYSETISPDREVTAKTRALLRQHAISDQLEAPGTIHELGVKELEALRQSQVNELIKTLNLRKVLAATVAQNAQAQPFLITIGERAEQVAQAYEDRHLTTQQALEAFEQLAQEYVESDTERQRLKLTPNAYAVYKIAQASASNVTAAQAQGIDQVFVDFPEYQWSQRQAKLLRARLYQVLRSVVDEKKIIEVANTLIEAQRV